jgi:amidase
VDSLLERWTQPGPLSRYVEDLALTLAVLAGPDGEDLGTVPVPLGDPTAVVLRGLRGAYFTDNGIAQPTEATRRTVARAVEVVIDAGVAMKESRPPGVERASDLRFRLAAADGGAWIRNELAAAGTVESPLLDRARAAAAAVEPLPADRFMSLWEEWGAFRRSAHGFWEEFDVLVCPVAEEPAFLVDGPRPAFGYTSLFNLTGWPVVVLRCGTSDEGLPIGLQVVAPPWREDVAIRLARNLEDSLGGWRRPAP